MNIKHLIRKNSPSILAGAGVAGFITAIVLTARAAPKAKKILDEKEAEKLSEKVKAVAPLYAPTAGMVLISTACIVASNHVMNMRYGALLALYAIGERNMQKLQDAIVEEFGEKKAEKVRERYVRPEEPYPVDFFEEEDKGERFQDQFSKRYFRASSPAKVREAMTRVNEEMFAEDFAKLNTFYFELGMEPLDFGDYWGWYADGGVVSVKLDSFLTKDDIPIISVSFDKPPAMENLY